jgi:DNA (cytosine-5)-methyltransferase 1
VTDTHARKLRALDLFCGAGGASVGLHRAGFEVVGVDVKPQPRYPFSFIQADALNAPVRLEDFDFVWASPPCQAHTSLKTMHNALEHRDLIPATRALLQASGRPWVMENVPGAPLQNTIVLCGTMFDLGCQRAELRRHRLFETSFPVLAPACRHGQRPVIGIYGGHQRNRKRTSGKNREQPDFTADEGRRAMGISWMSLNELSQAIPPAYSEFIAKAWLQSRQEERIAA